MLLLGVLLLSGTGYGIRAGLGHLREARPTGEVELFTVTRRSFPVTLQEEGELKAAQQIDIRCELEGKATIIRLVDEGKAVRKGDLLIEMASDEIDEKVRDTRSKEILAQSAFETARKELQILIEKNANDVRKADVKLSLARQAVSKYREGDAVQSRQEKQLAVDEAAYNLRRAKAQLSDSEDLYKQGFITGLEVENDRASAYQSQIKLQNARLALDVLNTYTIPMELQQKQSDLQDAEKELECKRKEAQASEEKLKAELQAKESDHKLAEEKLNKLLDQQKKTKILAPADGLVVYFKEEWWDESRIIKAGAMVHEQQILVQLPDTTSMKVTVRVHETKAEKLKRDLPAMIQIEGFTGRRFPGRVSKVAVLADSKDSWLNPNLKEYQTEVLLDGTFTELKPGVTAHVEIKLADLADVLAVPVQAVFGKGRKYYVFLRDGGHTRPVEVKPGLSSTEFVEIREGLKAGDRVCLAVADESRLMLPDDGAENKAGKWVAGTQPASTQPGSTQPASATQPASTRPASGPARPVESATAATSGRAPA
jgi:HlyD family secretion protein